MKQEIIEQIEIPEGVTCEYLDNIIKCKKDSQEISREIRIPRIEVKIDDNITISIKKGNQKDYKIIKTITSHLKNAFSGFENKYIYKLQSVNVHFPITLKVEGENLIINNFLGEKVPRKAKILPNVDVDIKGQDITVSSFNKESAGQTAANFEKATKVKSRDNRIFQDGIYIIEKPKPGVKENE